MFTGIVEEVGVVRRAMAADGGRDLLIEAETILSGLNPGDSLNVDGVCQTVLRTDAAGRTVAVHAIASTLSRTTLGEFESGREVNLERSLAVGDRLGGHFVQGHVDGVGLVNGVDRESEMVRVRFDLPEAVRPYAVPQGSIAVDGVSLTLDAVNADGTAEVALIPYTYTHTNLSRLVPGARVNLEADLIGKYVARMLSSQRGAVSRSDTQSEP